MNTISILGSTGSIGTQTLEVCKAYNIYPVALAANSNIELLEKQAREWKPKLVAVFNGNAASKLKTALADTEIKVVAGMDGLIEAACIEEAEIVLTAVVGMVGLLPTLAAIDAGKDIALANKETLVCAGDIVMAKAREKGIKILPVDSEHSAIFQCLQGAHDEKQVSELILTASGGPFFGWSEQQLKAATLEQALKHPNWSMGSKITIDSATLMNKGLEFIEAMRLFDMSPERISVVVHRESIIHSMIRYVDGSIIAQMGLPDMKLPIAYALTFPNRFDFGGELLDFSKCPSLTFATPDYKAFKCLSLAIEAAKKGGLATAVLNGANEAAVELFLNKKIQFYQISDCVATALNEVKQNDEVTIEKVLEVDSLARECVFKSVK